MGRIPKVDKERALEEARRLESQQLVAQQHQSQQPQAQQQRPQQNQLPNMLPEGSMLDRFLYGDRHHPQQPHLPSDQSAMSGEHIHSGPSQANVGPMHPLDEERRHNHTQSHVITHQSNGHHPHPQQYPNHEEETFIGRSENIKPYRENMYPQHAQVAPNTSQALEHQYSVEAHGDSTDPELHILPQIKTESSMTSCNNKLIQNQLSNSESHPASHLTGASMQSNFDTRTASNSDSLSPNSSCVTASNSPQLPLPDIIQHRVYSPHVIKELLNQVIEKKTVKEIPDPLLNKLITSIRNNHRVKREQDQQDQCETLSPSSSGFLSATYSEESQDKAYPDTEKRKMSFHSEEESPVKLHRANSVPYSNEEIIEGSNQGHIQNGSNDYRSMHPHGSFSLGPPDASQASCEYFKREKNLHGVYAPCSNLEGMKDEFDQYLDTSSENHTTQRPAPPLSKREQLLESTIDQLKIAFENSFAKERRAQLEMIQKHLALPEEERQKNFESESVEDLKMVWNQLINSIPKISQKILVFTKGIPGFNELNKEDQGKLIKDAYFDIWMITSSAYIQDGESYMVLENGMFYSKFWMSRILPADLIEKMYAIAEGFNDCQLTYSELSILCAVRITDPGRPEIKNTRELKVVHDHLLDCLAREVTRNHPESHSRILINVFRLLPSLDSLAEQSNAVIMNFSLQFSQDGLAGTGKTSSSSPTKPSENLQRVEQQDEILNKFDQQPMIKMSQ